MQHIEKCRMTDLWSLDTPLPIEVMRYEVPHIPLYGTCRGKLLGLLPKVGGVEEFLPSI